MKSSTKNMARGRFHQIKGKTREIIGIISDNRKLEAEGNCETAAGEVQEKIGRIEKVLGE